MFGEPIATKLRSVRRVGEGVVRSSHGTGYAVRLYRCYCSLFCGPWQVIPSHRLHVELLQPLILPLTSAESMPVKQLHDHLSFTPAAARKQRALQGFIIARQRYTPALRVKAVMAAAEKWRNGARGYLVGVAGTH
jgi:hypothetical protein